MLLCQVERIEPYTNSIFKVILRPSRKLSFKAGQYIMVSFSFGSLAFSIASSPLNNTELELHVGSSHAERKNTLILEELKHALAKNQLIEIDGPFGDAWLRGSNANPILLIAGGTGISYIASILKSFLSHGDQRPIYIYWGAKDMENLYLHEEFVKLALDNVNVSYVPVTELASTPQYTKHGLVLDIVINDFHCLSGFDIYLCGPLKMMEIARTRLCNERDAKRQNMYADAFSYI
ncbi:NAD(P)H-flavin reductase [Vibrio jasicida]|uniref:NAD(P)H-flavin reductase n=1 Tax=Vibrio harveyi group TaxID=717610 RepID=UPI000841C158|nr:MULTISPECIES: NAD(P)H-flavin reductase [Vibrio harveyi group]ODM56945.1 NAD(P)H-flavin reductase [Vibrio harveyi]PQJ55596.1 NAD(P)H-flavin reductase [Vibrio jasicida]